MWLEELIQRERLEGFVDTRPAVAPTAGDLALPLPGAHRELLELTDGLSGFAGHVRLFGYADDAGQGLAGWNDPETWKFAWTSRVPHHYLCFAQTAWGDQYGYRLSDEDASPSVYFLEALTMNAAPIAASFDDFIRDELLPNARSPRDPVTRDARATRGPLAADLLLVYTPSPLVSGIETLDHVDARAAAAVMIANGDVASQLARRRRGEVATDTEAYVDERGRPRVRVRFSSPASR